MSGQAVTRSSIQSVGTQSIPLDIFSHIFSFGKIAELGAFAVTSKYTFSVAIDIVKTDTSIFIEKMILSLHKFNSKHQTETLSLIKTDCDRITNLEDIQYIKREIINTAIFLTEERDVLASIPTPSFLGNICAVAKAASVCFFLTKRPTSRFDFGRDSALKDISKTCAEAEDFPRAIAVAKEITHRGTRNSALQDISETLAQKGYISEAITFIKTIPDVVTQFLAFGTIDILVMQTDIPKAIEVVKTFPLVTNQDCAYYRISKALAKQGDITKATEIANSIVVDTSLREKALKEIHSLKP